MTSRKGVDRTARGHASTDLERDDVAAIGADLHDIFNGLHEVRGLLDEAIASGDRRAVREARSKVDEHLKPDLRDLSKALRRFDRHLRKDARAG